MNHCVDFIYRYQTLIAPLLTILLVGAFWFFRFYIGHNLYKITCGWDKKDGRETPNRFAAHKFVRETINQTPGWLQELINNNTFDYHNYIVKITRYCERCQLNEFEANITIIYEDDERGNLTISLQEYGHTWINSSSNKYLNKDGTAKLSRDELVKERAIKMKERNNQ